MTYPPADYSPLVLADQGLTAAPVPNPAKKPHAWRREHRDEVIRTLAAAAPERAFDAIRRSPSLAQMEPA